jgi:hypothetical protein
MSLEEKRRRRAKRKAKQARAKMERGRLPRFIACHYLKNLIPPDAGVLQDAFEYAKDRTRWMQLPYRPLGGTVPCQCWVNVEKAVALWGGRMVCGWSFRIDPLEGFTNCMADIEARPHAVWGDEGGQLWEVSADCRGAYFLPSDKVRPYLALNVGFADNEFQARTYRPPDPFLAGSPQIGNSYIRVGKEGR